MLMQVKKGASSYHRQRTDAANALAPVVPSSKVAPFGGQKKGKGIAGNG